MIGSCVFFAATIYSMFFLKLIFIIICFTLHSIFLLLFCYVCYSDQMDKEISLKTYHQEVGMEIAEKEEELTEAKGQVKMKESLLEQVRSQIEVLRSQNTSFKNEATDLHSRIRKLEEEKTPVYLTVDLDCLDPSLFSGTGTPEAGGVSFAQLLEAILAVSRCNIVGADVNELAPMLDASGASTAAACKIVREMLLAIYR